MYHIFCFALYLLYKKKQALKKAMRSNPFTQTLLLLHTTYTLLCMTACWNYSDMNYGFLSRNRSFELGAMLISREAEKMM